MVHGNYYGVQYEIYLNKKLDLFNNILPICIDVRKMISLEKVDKNSDQYKLVIIPYRELDKRFEKRENVHKYVENLDKLSYRSFEYDRKSHSEVFKYYDVKMYKSLIKYNDQHVAYTQEQLKECKKRFEDIKDMYDSEDFWNKSNEERKEIDIEQGKLRQILNIQNVISNPEYFDEIKQIEKELTYIELTDGEKELINKVLSHPKLEGSIYCHGINLIEGFF